MGRQIQLSMLPEDRDAILSEIRSEGFVEIVRRDGDASEVQGITHPFEAHGETLILWNKKLISNLQRKLIQNATPIYYRVDESALPVLEFSTSVLTDWNGKPALTQGRIYGQFIGKSAEFEKWYERIVRRIRKRWHRNPVALLGGYVGTAAYEWFTTGGLLLPMFAPPVTEEWIQALGKQHS